MPLDLATANTVDPGSGQVRSKKRDIRCAASRVITIGIENASTPLAHDLVGSRHHLPLLTVASGADLGLARHLTTEHHL